MIGIVTINDYSNLGNRLQNYAMYTILSKYDETYNIVIFYGSGGVKDGDCYKPSLVKNILRVPYHMALSIKSSLTNHNQYLLAKEREKNFLEFNKYIIDQDEITPKTDYETLNAKYDYFVAGSDQVWNPNFYKMYINMLGFASSEKKVAVSPSVSVETLTDDQMQEFIRYLSDYKALSCREEQGSKLIESIVGRECTTLVDPTLMLSKEEWDQIIKKPVFHDENKKYVLLYFLGNLTEEYKGSIAVISDRYNLEVIDVLDKNSRYYTCGPAEFVWMIKHAELILTDSFHGSVLSYIYDKPFRIFGRVDGNVSMNSRLVNLLDKLQLSEKTYITKDSSLDNLLEVHYDKHCLEAEQKKFRKYLDEAFERGK